MSHSRFGRSSHGQLLRSSHGWFRLSGEQLVQKSGSDAWYLGELTGTLYVYELTQGTIAGGPDFNNILGESLVGSSAFTSEVWTTVGFQRMLDVLFRTAFSEPDNMFELAINYTGGDAGDSESSHSGWDYSVERQNWRLGRSDGMVTGPSTASSVTTISKSVSVPSITNGDLGDVDRIDPALAGVSTPKASETYGAVVYTNEETTPARQPLAICPLASPITVPAYDPNGGNDWQRASWYTEWSFRLVRA